MNFNDMFSAFYTMFALMIVNNWYVIVDIYIIEMDNNTTYRYCFMAFYYFAVIIGSNIFVAFILDMYDAVITLEDERKCTFDGL
jgi:hypothetical protein